MDVCPWQTTVTFKNPAANGTLTLRHPLSMYPFQRRIVTLVAALYGIALTTPPSTRSAAPLVALAAGLHT